MKTEINTNAKEKYEVPEIAVVRFDTHDVISTSGLTAKQPVKWILLETDDTPVLFE